MNIYSPLAITEEMIVKFVPTRLYIKRHLITGLRYLGKTIQEDINSYKGSGKRWKNHLRSHGKEFVVNEWVSDWFTNPVDLQDFALLISQEFDIVSSDNWANLKPEYGVEGNRPIGELNGMFGTSRKGKDNPFYNQQHTEESKSKMGPRGQTMPDSHKKARSKLMLTKANPMNNSYSVQKIRDSMTPVSVSYTHLTLPTKRIV